MACWGLVALERWLPMQSGAPASADVPRVLVLEHAAQRRQQLLLRDGDSLRFGPSQEAGLPELV